MADPTNTPEGFSLKRWSRRKLEAARNVPEPVMPAAVEAVPAPPMVAAAAPAPAPVADEAPVLPPVESLTHDSDFSAFMQPKVDEAVRRAALKKLFTDPRFNVMDGLDIYVGDYTQPDPMPEGMLEKLGKVYAAVTHDDEAEAQLAAAAAVPATVAAESLPAPAAPLATALPESATETAPEVTAAPPARAAVPVVPIPTRDATAAIPSPPPPSGKSQ